MAYFTHHHVAHDGLSREYWCFDLTVDHDGFAMVLRGYGIERRDQNKGRFRSAKVADRWDAMDERRYNSGISRPHEIPYEIACDALMSKTIAVYLGWNNAECAQYDIRIADIG